jgi:hypothetical protein
LLCDRDAFAAAASSEWMNIWPAALSFYSVSSSSNQC